jgi:hypothetical protein
MSWFSEIFIWLVIILSWLGNIAGVGLMVYFYLEQKKNIKFLQQKNTSSNTTGPITLVKASEKQAG